MSNFIHQNNLSHKLQLRLLRKLHFRETTWTQFSFIFGKFQGGLGVLKRSSLPQILFQEVSLGLRFYLTFEKILNSSLLRSKIMASRGSAFLFCV